MISTIKSTRTCSYILVGGLYLYIILAPKLNDAISQLINELNVQGNVSKCVVNSDTFSVMGSTPTEKCFIFNWNSLNLAYVK